MTRRLRWLVALLLAFAGSLPALPAAAAPQYTGPHWVASWGSPMAWGYGEASQVSVRQVVPLSVGGSDLRVRISNVFGNTPMIIGAATVGRQQQGAALVPGSVEPLTFSGASSATVPVGQVITSDPLVYPTTAGEVLEVSLYVPNTELVSVHPCCTSTPFSYFTPNGAGDRVAAVDAAAFPDAQQWSRWVDAVDVYGTAPSAVVAFGDSITDGFHTSLRWSDVLIHRLSVLPPSQRPAVINEAITANTAGNVPHDDALLGGGPPGVDRLARDVLDQPGARTMIVLLGTNDLWFGATAAQVEASLTTIADEARAAGVEPIGVTLLPRWGSLRWTAQDQLELQAVDAWIRTSPTFPVVLDWANVVADHYNGACFLNVMYPPFDSGDHLHPNPAGQTAMADSIPTQILGTRAVPPVPELVQAVPTAGCPVGPTVIYHTTAAVHSSPAPSVAASPSASPSPSPPAASPSDAPRALAANSSGPSPWVVGAVVALIALIVGWLLGRRSGAS